jgi:hypothetical protein
MKCGRNLSAMPRDSNLRLKGIHIARDEETYVIHNARSTEADVSVRLVLPVALVPGWLEDAKCLRCRCLPV